MDCPKCGKPINVMTLAMCNGYYAFLVHGQETYRGYKFVFKEDSGCFITEEEYNNLYRDQEDIKDD